MTSETKRDTNRQPAISAIGSAATCGCLARFAYGLTLACVTLTWMTLTCSSTTFAQTNDAPRLTGTGVRHRQWITEDPLPMADASASNVSAAPVARTAPTGDTVSVHSLQLPARAIKEFQRSEKCVGHGDYSCAVQHLQKALRVDPRFIEAHNNLGASYMQLQRYNDAIAEFQAAIAINPKMEAPYRNMSLSLFLLRRYPEAEAAARQALALNPEHKAARYSLGRALAAEGSASAETESLLRESVGEFPEARLPLAQVLLNRCAHLDAAAELRTYLDSNVVEPEKRRQVQAWLDLSSKRQASSGCDDAKPAA